MITFPSGNFRGRVYRMPSHVSDKPYQFIPPHRGNFWPWVLKLYATRYVEKRFGITHLEYRGTEKLTESIKAGHGVLIAPNHCRWADPVVSMMLSKHIGKHFFIMASAHLFRDGWFTPWAINRAGAFSVLREGVDRAAVNTAIDILVSAERPLVIFPEGAISRTNDHLMSLMEGVPFIARSAAKKRKKKNANGTVVIHPVAFRYLFKGDLQQTAEPVLDQIETRLSWRPQRHLPMFDRIANLGFALLSLKEMEYFGESQTGTLAERLEALIDRLLSPLEDKYLEGEHKHGGTGDAIPRVKALRTSMLPDIIEGKLSDEELETRWREFEDIDLAQQISLYPPDYIASNPTADRILETIEKFEDNLSGENPPHPPMHVIINVGDAIEVEAKRRREPDGDPLLLSIESQIEQMLGETANESPSFESPR